MTHFKLNWTLLIALLLNVSTGSSCSSQTANSGAVNPTNEEERQNGSTPTETETVSVTTRDAGESWTRFRGPQGLGISQTRGLPLQWGENDNLAWKLPLPGAGASSPIVYGDHIYLTTYTGYFVPHQPGGSLEQLERHLVCIDKTSGQILWDKAVKAKLPEESQIRDHGFAANTPTADAERVYAFFGKTGVFAFDHQGNQLWQADVGSNTHGWGTSSSPVLFEDLLLINASVESESLIALDKNTGQKKWSAKGMKEAWNTPHLVKTSTGENELVLATHGQVLGMNPLTGDQLWNCATDITWYMVPSLVDADGIVYSLGGRSGTAALAIRTGGRGNVTTSHRLWTSNKGSNVTSPVYFDGHLYWMHEQLGIAYCCEAKTGELVYQKRLDRAEQVYASTLLADGRLYYLNRNGRTFVVAAKPEFELLATNDLRDGTVFDASPAVIDGKLLLRSNKFLYCVGQ